MRIPSLRERIKKLFEAKRVLTITLSALVSRSVYFTWILWDAILSIKLYKHQKMFPDQLLRFFRLGIGIGWFFGLVSPVTAGIVLIADGVFSILRYRALNVTKNAIEDLPRLVRISTGLMMFPLVGI